MRSKPLAAGLLTALLLAIPLAAQTTAELLQRGIFSQETEGNLDNAIAIYRQIVQSSSPQRDLVAQAQLRLGQALLQKGSLDLAAAEFQRLARDFADQQAVISRLSAQASNMVYEPSANAEALARMADLRKSLDDLKATHTPVINRIEPMLTAAVASTFDHGRPVTIQGAVTTVLSVNPTGVIVIDAKDSTGEKYLFMTAAANALIRQGMNRTSLTPGQPVTVTGVLADDGKRLPTGEIVAKANTITAQDGTIVWDRARPLAPLQALPADQVK